MSVVRTRLAPVVGLAVLLAACVSDGPDYEASTQSTEVRAALDGATVVVHRSALCDCCGAYEAYLEELGLVVEPVVHDDLVPIKDGFGVPARQRSCHTSEVGGHVVEGHVPLEAVVDLLARAPEVDGISLAGMPPGSPGMPGPKGTPFDVMMFVDGEVVGELGRY